jgi:hypothetical protein
MQPVAKKRRKKAQTSKQEAFFQGLDAYETNASCADVPFAEADLAQHWEYGWHAGQVLETRGAGVPIYSVLSPEATSPDHEDSLYRSTLWGCSRQGWRSAAVQREDYPALPWTMDAIVPSTWINIHTGIEMRVGDVLPDRFGYPIPVEAGTVFERDQRFFDRLGLGLGFWTYSRFVIEHWVRVDHLPPDARVRWFGVEIASIRRKIAQSRSSIAEMDAAPHKVSCYSTNRNIRLRDIEYGEKRLQKAVQRMQAFANDHGLMLTSEQLNGLDVDTPHTAPPHGTPEQLMLL